MYKRILVPLDGSEQAEAVLPHARALAENTWAEIVLLRVVPERRAEPLIQRPVQEFYAESADAVQFRTPSYVERIADQLRARNLKVTTEVRCGQAAETILRCAENLHADMIAIATYGESGPTPWLMDNTTQQVTRQARIPVLLVGGGMVGQQGANLVENARLTSI